MTKMEILQETPNTHGNNNGTKSNQEEINKKVPYF